MSRVESRETNNRQKIPIEDRLREFQDKTHKYLERRDTFLAKGLNRISDKRGPEWRKSRGRDFAGRIIAFPAAAAATPVILGFAAATFIEDRKFPFYVQYRKGQNGKEFPLVKLRCMKVGSDQDPHARIHNSSTYSKAGDPRNTRVGRFMRRFNLEELPQLWQVALGQLRLVDLRAVPEYVMDHFKEECPESFRGWERAYTPYKPGLFNYNSVANPESE